MQARQAAQTTYRDIALASRAAGASPHELVVMLYEGVVAALGRASYAAKYANMPACKTELHRAIDILNALHASLDFARGGLIAKNLGTLYAYVQTRLTQALHQSDHVAIDEAEKLLRDVADAWLAIAPKPAGFTPC